MHGLRKAGSRRLAQAGATPHEIMAVTGHKSLAEVQRYTRGVEQERAAEAAFSKLERDAGGAEQTKKVTNLKGEID